jgi:RHS repeat-associated protein
MTLQMTGNDRFGSPQLSLSGGSSSVFSWSPFGGGTTRTGAAISLPGFNGERQDPLSGVSHLGNGYRAYSPALRRFTCPDSESPFGIGGLNPYVYCDSDPVNRTDPSGHGPITWLLRKTISLAARLGMKAETAEAMTATLHTIGAVETGTILSAQLATGVSGQIARARGNFVAARELGWATLGTGIAGGFGMYEGDIGTTVKKLRGASKTYRVANSVTEAGVAIAELSETEAVTSSLPGVRENTGVSLISQRPLQEIDEDGQNLNLPRQDERIDADSRPPIASGSTTRPSDVNGNRELHKRSDYNSLETAECYSGNGEAGSFASRSKVLSGKDAQGQRGRGAGRSKSSVTPNHFTGVKNYGVGTQRQRSHIVFGSLRSFPFGVASTLTGWESNGLDAIYTHL